MEIRPLTDDYAVSPQITVADVAAIRAAGFATLIDNRPDAEIAPGLHTDAIRTAAEAAGLTFVANPIVSGALTSANVDVQREAIEASAGKVLAYCASGNRSSVVWALALAGRMPTDALIDMPARHGYALEGLRAELDRRAANA